MDNKLTCPKCGEVHPYMVELLEELEDSVNQSCHTKDGLLDSMALSSFASNLRLLAKLGRVEIKSENGRRVIAKWLPK